MGSNRVPQRVEPTGLHEARDIGDELLFYDRSGDRLHLLNGVAREIYLLCDGARTREDIQATIVERYDVDADRAREDVLRTLGELLDLGLVRESNHT